MGNGWGDDPIGALMLAAVCAVVVLGLVALRFC